jgi:hypothetical protein
MAAIFSTRLYGMSLQGTQINGFPDFLRGETRKISRPFTRRGVIGPRRESKDISLTILGFCISRIREIKCFSFPENISVRPCELGRHRLIRSHLKFASGGSGSRLNIGVSSAGRATVPAAGR